MFKVYKFFLESLYPCKVYARNSLVTKRISPFLSDIDLTILLLTDEPAEKLKQIYRTHKNLKKFLFPVLGELQIWPKAWEPLIVKNLNSYEKMRASSYLRESADPTKYEAVVFLLRMIDADIENLVYNPADRYPKWSGHFQDLQLSSFTRTELNLDFLLSNVIKLIELNIEESEHAFCQLKEYYQFRLSGTKPHHWDEVLLKKPWLWVLFPQTFAHSEKGLPKLTPQQMNLIEQNFRWEISGLLAHTIMHYDLLDQFHQHSLNLLSKTKQLNLSTDLIQDLIECTQKMKGLLKKNEA